MIYISKISFSETSFLEGTDYRNISVPDFSGYFEKNEMRRLSPIIRTAVGCGLEVANNYRDSLCGIIVGTGRGCLSKLEQFLADINKYRETALNPSVFIQSTNNTIGGQIALKLNINTYNMTYVNQGFTVLNVLTDAEMLTMEHPGKKVLFGFFDENTDFNQKIHREAGFLSTKDGSELIYGQGVSFFLASGSEDEAMAKIKDFRLLDNGKKNETQKAVQEFLSDIPMDESLAIYSGYNNEYEQANLYGTISSFIAENDIPEIAFKRETGDFDTASGMALALAIDQVAKGEFDKIIIFNHYKKISLHSITVTKP